MKVIPLPTLEERQKRLKAKAAKGKKPNVSGRYFLALAVSLVLASGVFIALDEMLRPRLPQSFFMLVRILGAAMVVIIVGLVWAKLERLDSKERVACGQDDKASKPMSFGSFMGEHALFGLFTALAWLTADRTIELQHPMMPPEAVRWGVIMVWVLAAHILLRSMIWSVIEVAIRGVHLFEVICAFLASSIALVLTVVFDSMLPMTIGLVLLGYGYFESLSWAKKDNQTNP